MVALGSSFVPPTLYNSNTSQPYSSSPRYSTDSYSPSIDTPSNMFTPMMPSENLSPMEGGCHSLTSPNNPVSVNAQRDFKLFQRRF